MALEATPGTSRAPPALGTGRKPAPRGQVVTQDPSKKKRTYREVACSYKVGIVGKSAFSEEETARIKQGIIKAVSLRPSPTPPEFHSVLARYGHIIATVADMESVIWLLTYESLIRKTSGTHLQIFKEENMPKRHLYKGIFTMSASETNVDILHLLESFSRGFSLHAARWTVVRRVDDGDTAIMFLCVDDASDEAIRERKGFLPYRLGHARLTRVEESPPAKPAVEVANVIPPAEAQPQPLVAAQEQQRPKGTAKVKQLTIKEATRRSPRHE